MLPGGERAAPAHHQQQRGLPPEPPQDQSGYRRYGAQHAIQLLKIKTLADAGVPLARVEELLAAGAGQFSTAIAEIEAFAVGEPGAASS